MFVKLYSIFFVRIAYETGIKNKYWDRQAYANCRLRSDATEKGMKLVMGNREQGNLENTF